MKRRAPRISAGIALVLLSLVSPAAALEEAERLWLVGERAFADGLYPASRRALERFVAQYPKDARVPDAVLLLGKARLQAGDAQAALEAFKRAQTLTPVPGRPQEARFWEAETLFRLKRFLDARDAYDAVVLADAAGPLAPEAFYGRAWSDLELKREEAAVAGFRELISAFPNHTLAPSATLQAARALADLKRPSEALSLLADFPKKYPSSPLVADAQFWSGWIKSTSGTDPSGGVAELEAFVAAHPNHPQAATARRLVPQALARSSNPADQLKAYKALMEQNPPTAEALYSAAEVAGRLNRPHDREAAWKRLSTDFPDHPLTLKLALDFGTAAFKQKSWKSAATYATQATKSDDDAVRSEAWLLLGESELKQKRFADAAKAFEAVGTVSEVETGVRFRALAGLGLAREEQQSWKAALAAYEAVAARSPDATLRDWARERAGAVKARLSNPAPSKSAPSGGNKSGMNATKPAAKKDSKP
jgi:TolA-binding protein